MIKDIPLSGVETIPTATGVEACFLLVLALDGCGEVSFFAVWWEEWLVKGSTERCPEEGNLLEYFARLEVAHVLAVKDWQIGTV